MSTHIFGCKTRVEYILHFATWNLLNWVGLQCTKTAFWCQLRLGKVGKVRKGLWFFAIIVPNRAIMSEKLLESSRAYFFLHRHVKQSSWNYSGLVKRWVLSHQTSTKFVRVVTFFVPVGEPICVLSPPSANHVQVVAPTAVSNHYHFCESYNRDTLALRYFSS